MEDKRNLSRHTTGKKRATLILIPSIRFTKLIIHHLQRRHKFHPRPDSALHLANDESVLGYLKFCAKGTKREVFGMPIPGRLITADIREASYYREYQENVSKHRGFMASETGSTQDLLAPKQAKPSRKPKSTAQKAPPKPSISTLVASTQPAPTSDPAKSQENKRKQATETTDRPTKGKRIKHSISRKTRQPRSSPKSVGTSEVEEKISTALEVPGKGKAKVTEEQVAHDLLSLQKPKRKNPVEQYIFQRRIFEPTGSSFHDESPYDVLGQSDSEDESKKVLTGASEGDNDDVQTGPDPDVQNEGQKETDADTLDEGQVGSNPDERSEGQAGPDTGITGNEEQSIPNHVVHAGSDREHMNLNVTKVSPQPSTEQLDEGFLATTYPKNQESLKLAVEEQVLLEEPASSSGTLSSLHHLSKDISFGDQFFSDKPLDVDKNAKTKVESMVSIAVSEVVTDAIDWAMQAPLRNRIRDLPEADMKEILHQRMWETESYKIHEDHSLLFEALKNSMNRDHSEELAQDLAEARKKKRKRRESPKTPPGSPPHQPPPPPPPTGPYGPSKAPGASGSQVTPPPPPPPPPPSTSQDNPSKGSAASSPSKTAAFTEHQAWTTPDVMLRPFIPLTLADLDMDEAMGPDKQAQLSDDKDIGSAHIPTVNLRQDWWKPLEKERVATPELAWSIPSSDAPVTLNNWASALASDYLPPPEDSLLAQTGDMATFIDCVDNFIPRNNVSKHLPLGGPPGQVTIQSDFFFNKDLEYLRYESKGNRHALLISKMKAAYYPDVGLEQMIPVQFWINEECKYDIAAMYGISHWWFQRQRFSIDRHTSEGDRNTVRTHMRILSVVLIELFSMYGYDYMKKIVFRRADLNEHIIAERDFKYLYPSDFKDLYLLNLQGHLNHLPPKDKRILSTAVNQWIRQLVIRQRVKDFQLGIESYQTWLNLTKPQWDATGFEKDVDRCKAFMFTIQRRLWLRRIYRNLESFVGGRLREGDYRLLKRTE
nr:E-beta-farnesene synthase [Tanacetum cinerariifolium]